MQDKLRRSVNRGRVVVVLGMSETGLSTMRLLGRAGLRCWGVDTRPDLPAFASRYCERPVLLSEGDPLTELLSVLGECEKVSRGKPVILPTSDPFVRLLGALRDRVPGRFDMALPSRRVLDDLLDKRRFAARSAKVGLRVPKTTAVSSLWRIREDLAYVGFPALVKPRSRAADVTGLPKAVILWTERDVLSFQARHAHLSGPELIVQEYIPGDDTHEVSVAVALDARSRVLATFVARKRRQGNGGAGVGTFVERHVDDEAAEVASRFLREIGYVGVAEVELKRHAETGVLYAIEVNPRLWSQVALPAAAGLDFPQLEYRIATGATERGSRASDVALAKVTWQNLWSDFYWTFCGGGYWRRGEITALSWLYQTLTCHSRSYFAWRDPLPVLRCILQGLAGIARRARARLQA